MKTVELFCGTKSFSKVAADHGHETFTVDNDLLHNPDLLSDILKVASLPECWMLWASPPCEGFSVAVIGRNWNHDYTPKHARAELAMQIAKKTLELIHKTAPRWYFIENPVGMLRKMPFMEEFLAQTGGVRHKITYCQYGDTRMKPTDIWTNAHWWRPRAACKSGMTCHVSAPRGSRTGTQGLKGSVERSRIPAELFKEIFSQL